MTLHKQSKKERKLIQKEFKKRKKKWKRWYNYTYLVKQLWSLLGRYTNMKWEAEASPLGLHICNKTTKSKQIQIVIKKHKALKRERERERPERRQWRREGERNGRGHRRKRVVVLRNLTWFGVAGTPSTFLLSFFFFTFIRNSQGAEPLRSLHDFYFYFFDWTGWDCLRIRNLWKN